MSYNVPSHVKEFLSAQDWFRKQDRSFDPFSYGTHGTVCCSVECVYDCGWEVLFHALRK